MGPQCAHYAPTMRPLGAHYVHKPPRRGTDEPKVRPHAATMRPLSS
jgi:hypothetical protein